MPRVWKFTEGFKMDRLENIYSALRDIVAAAEMAGWDIGENTETLQRGRDALAALREEWSIPNDAE
jgi:hypothetical protein